MRCSESQFGRNEAFGREKAFSFRGVTLSPVEEKVFEVLSSPRMNVEIVSHEPAGSVGRLRVKDRVFACIGNDPESILWLEVAEITATGYAAVQLTAQGPSSSIELCWEGKGLLRGRPVEVVAVDDLMRICPLAVPQAITNFRAYRDLGISTDLKTCISRSNIKTNQLFINAHRQAIVTLEFGQFFIAGGDVWLVSQKTEESFSAVRMRDDHVAAFNRLGVSLDSPGCEIEASILSESDYDHDGWMHELAQHAAEGYPSNPIFQMSPASLASAGPGTKLVLNAGTGLQASIWGVVGDSGGDLVIQKGGLLGTLDLATGLGSAAAAGHQFLAVVENPFLASNDVSSMMRSVIIFA